MIALGSRTRLAVIICCAAAAPLIACSKGDRRAATDTVAGGVGSDSATAAATTASSATPLSLASVAGKWNIRATPDTGHASPTLSVLSATSDTAGWTLIFPNRKPVPVHVVAVSGDSIVTESEPYESVLRKGVRVTTRGVYRMQGGKLVGTTMARYQTPRADSVVLFRTEGTRAP